MTARRMINMSLIKILQFGTLWSTVIAVNVSFYGEFSANISPLQNRTIGLQGRCRHRADHPPWDLRQHAETSIVVTGVSWVVHTSVPVGCKLMWWWHDSEQGREPLNKIYRQLMVSNEEELSVYTTFGKEGAFLSTTIRTTLLLSTTTTLNESFTTPGPVASSTAPPIKPTSKTAGTTISSTMTTSATTSTTPASPTSTLTTSTPTTLTPTTLTPTTMLISSTTLAKIAITTNNLKASSNASVFQNATRSDLNSASFSTSTLIDIHSSTPNTSQPNTMRTTPLSKFTITSMVDTRTIGDLLLPREGAVWQDNHTIAISVLSAAILLGLIVTLLCITPGYGNKKVNKLRGLGREISDNRNQNQDHTIPRCPGSLKSQHVPDEVVYTVPGVLRPVPAPRAQQGNYINMSGSTVQLYNNSMFDSNENAVDTYSIVQLSTVDDPYATPQFH